MGRKSEFGKCGEHWPLTVRIDCSQHILTRNPRNQRGVVNTQPFTGLSQSREAIAQCPSSRPLNAAGSSRGSIPVPVGYSNPAVPMVKTTQDWQGEYAS